MRHVPFDPDKDLKPEQRIWWDKWSARAAAQRKALIAKRKKGTAVEFHGSIWSDLKAWLLDNVFHGKCAYCEVKVTPGFFGDGEHYRPKGNVTVADATGVRRTVTAAGKSHPGYYWLAYDWRNLLPSCSRCNNAKLDQFPVAAAHVYAAGPEPADLDQAEQPLLINPYLEEAGRHLAFGEFGVVSAIDDDPRGVATIKVFGLDRKDLTDDRWVLQQQAVNGIGPAVLNVLTGAGGAANLIELWMGPRAQYSRAVRAYALIRGRILFDELFGKL